jgi:hypothetical protein
VIKFSIDPRKLVKDMNDVGERQIPFAMMKTLNNTAEDVQAEQQEHIARKFTLRRPTFILNTVKINRGDFATKDNLRAIVRIDPDRDVLSKFEDRGQEDGTCSLAMPSRYPSKPSDLSRTSSPTSSRPRALQLAECVHQRIGEDSPKGLKRTFMIQKPDGSGGIFQRQGAWQRVEYPSAVQAEGAVPLPKSLQFVENATRVVNEKLPENWAKWFAEAMRTAR